ncbi:MAG: NAD(P)/FAD-dependent oxidoreductase [Burkholderiales bacterium]
MSGIVIVGGGVIGSSIALYLARAGRAAEVTVLEPDPTYEWAASPRAVGGVRRLFGTAENVAMSNYGMEVYTHFRETILADGVDYDPAFRREGYLFQVWGEARVRALEADADMQRALGVEVELLDRDALKRRWPSFGFAQVDAAALSPADGRIDPNAALMGFRRSAERLGVRYLKDRLTSIEHTGGRVTTAVLASGTRLPCAALVNAANCWAPEVCAMVGMRVPIAPLKRQTFHFDARDPVEAIPAMRDQSGFTVRPEGQGFLTGVTRVEDAGRFDWTLDPALFDETLWPELASRAPKFEAVRMKGGWVGHYDQCLLDGNPVIGPWTGTLDNFYLVAGFSGHGLQHAPAVGRGLAEWLTTGRYQSLDLSIFGYQRVVDNRPIVDRGPTA